MIQALNITIPKRENAPQTTLFVKISSKNEQSIKTKPFVFILPGGPGANHSFYNVYNDLIDVANIVFHDPRGCGLSAKDEPKTYNMENYIYDVEIIRQSLRLNKIIVLGKSYGATCAIAYSLQFPQNVNKLIVAAGAASFKFIDTAKVFIATKGNKEQKKVFKTLVNGAFENQDETDHYFSVMDTLYSYKKSQEEIITNAPEYPIAYEPLNQGFGNFLRSFNFENHLNEILCPTLVLVGENDWITAKEHSELIANKILHSTLKIFPKASHALEIDAPQDFFSIIRNFIERE